MGGVGGIVVAIFGVIWTIGALSMGAPPFFALFGLLFVVMAIAGVVYNFYNATSRNRMSSFDVTTDGEESFNLTWAYPIPGFPAASGRGRRPGPA